MVGLVIRLVFLAATFLNLWIAFLVSYGVSHPADVNQFLPVNPVVIWGCLAVSALWVLLDDLRDKGALASRGSLRNEC